MTFEGKERFYFFSKQVKPKNPNWVLPLEQKITKFLHPMWYHGTHK